MPSSSRESRERVVASFFFCVRVCARCFVLVCVTMSIARSPTTRIIHRCNLFFDFCHAVRCF